MVNIAFFNFFSKYIGYEKNCYNVITRKAKSMFCFQQLSFQAKLKLNKICFLLYIENAKAES